MINNIVKERGVNLAKNPLGWKYIELVAYQYDSKGKAIDSKYINLEVDDNKDLFVCEYEDEYSAESLEELVDLLRTKYNTHLEAGAYFYLKLMLKVEFEYPN
jgi:hypothetical protein